MILMATVFSPRFSVVMVAQQSLVMSSSRQSFPSQVIIASAARVGATHPLHAVCQSAGHLGVLGKSLHRRALSGGRSRVLVRRRHDGVRNSEQKCVEADRRVEYAVR